MKTGIYRLYDDDVLWNPRDITIKARETEKSYILTLIEDKTRYPDGRVEMMFGKKNRTVFPKNPKHSPHYIETWEDAILMYPFRDGIPFYFRLQECQQEES